MGNIISEEWERTSLKRLLLIIFSFFILIVIATISWMTFNYFTLTKEIRLKYVYSPVQCRLIAPYSIVCEGMEEKMYVNLITRETFRQSLIAFEPWLMK